VEAEASEHGKKNQAINANRSFSNQKSKTSKEKGGLKPKRQRSRFGFIIKYYRFNSNKTTTARLIADIPNT
jgi:hypothetical protein